MIVHVVYDNEESAKVAHHQMNNYAVAHVKSKLWFETKDAFMALVIKAFEDAYDKMKLDARPTDSKG